MRRRAEESCLRRLPGHPEKAILIEIQAVAARAPLTRDHALDGAVLCRAEHVEGLLELFKVEAMRDERLHVHQLLGQQVDGDRVAVEKRK